MNPMSVANCLMDNTLNNYMTVNVHKKEIFETSTKFVYTNRIYK